MAITLHREAGLTVLRSELLAPLPHGFSTRPGGVSPAPWDSLNLGPSRGDALENVWENYHRFCAVLGTEPEQAVLSQQTHTTNLRRVTAEDAGKGLIRPRDYRDVDALMTDVPGLALTVFSADCGVILLHDPVHAAIAAVHAGWRGCAGGILAKTVRAMTESCGTDPADLLAAIGPCIGPCCFETDADVPDAMRAALGSEAGQAIRPAGAKFYVDLKRLNAIWLRRAGVTCIDISADCTACQPQRFWSHRRVGNARGSLAAIIRLREEG